MITEYLLKNSLLYKGLMTMDAGKKKLAVALTITIIFFSLTLANIKMVSSSDIARKIDVFTQKMTFNGKGMNQSSDSFQPQELVILYALVTYNEVPLANMLVAFQVNNPANAFQNVTVVGISSTNQSGIAQFSFRIPWPSENAEQTIFGEWFAIATVDIAEQVAVDTLTFQVGWIIKITNITTLNAELGPQTKYLRGAIIAFNLTIENIALTPKLATIIIDAQDAASYPIIHTEIDNLVFKPGENHMSVPSQIPMTATIGEATILTVAYTAPPKIGGAPYSPAALSTFEIVRLPAKEYYLAVKSDPDGVTAISGEGWYNEDTNVLLTAPEYVSVLTGVRCKFSYWDVDGISQGLGIYEIAVRMDANHTATANYVTQYLVTFDLTGLDLSASRTVVTINGSPKTLSELPYNLWVDNGMVIAYSYGTLVSSSVSGKRFNLLNVSGPDSPITVTEQMTVKGNYKTQYHLTVKTDPPGIMMIPGEGWYNQHENVTLIASPVKGYDFGYWDVDGASQGIGVNTVTVHMNSPHTATVHYSTCARRWYIPGWFLPFLLLLLLLAIILLIAWHYYRKRKRAEEAFYSGWTAWYYGYDMRKRTSKT
jgi:hypothetical protein